MNVELDRDASERLAIFARFPEPGRAKTRLIPALGPDGAARVHGEMVRHTLRTTDVLSARRAVAVEVWYTGGDAERFRANFGLRAYRSQSEGDLGERMADAFRSMLAEVSAAVIVGTDCPALDPNTLVEAFNALRTHDLVLGPASDGGYYLVGLRKHSPGLFEGMAWGTDVVLAETRRRAEVFGLRVHELPILDDVDEPKDLSVWEKHRLREFEGIEQKPSLSVVIPTLNEEARIAATIDSARRDGVEIIVADGGSSDSTMEVASRQGARLVLSSPGRGSQLNAGAAVAGGDHLLFLHADTTLPDGYLEAVQEIMAAPGVVLGAFRLRIDRPGLSIRIVELGVRIRCALWKMPYGDQAMFLRAESFRRLGGFAEIPLMEDIDLVRRTRAIGSIRIVPQAAVTSGRRWESAGVLRMTLVNLSCAIGFRLGVPTAQLAAWRDRLSKMRAKSLTTHQDNFDQMRCTNPSSPRKLIGASVALRAPIPTANDQTPV